MWHFSWQEEPTEGELLVDSDWVLRAHRIVFLCLTLWDENWGWEWEASLGEFKVVAIEGTLAG